MPIKASLDESFHIEYPPTTDVCDESLTRHDTSDESDHYMDLNCSYQMEVKLISADDRKTAKGAEVWTCV